MKVEGVYTFPGQPQQVWEVLLNPDSLRACIPGVESLTETSPDHWDAVMKVGVAAHSIVPVGVVFSAASGKDHVVVV